MNNELIPIVRPGLARFALLIIGFGVAIATLALGIDTGALTASTMSLASLFAGGAILFFMRANRRSVYHSTDEIVVENDGEVITVPKAGTTIEVREVEQYGFRGHRQYVNFVDESTRPSFDNTKTAKTYLFLLPVDGDAVRVEAGIGKSPKALRELHHDLELAIDAR